ncbi:aminotransferase class I/II-fold pyridoxal phosphate-dependent enzyme [Frigoribacterium sp. VKM Ac-1396]|uniref:DegT/DnrJ/EryC1/StrS family aminotransferase n=1 Tax=Frigoribacterium sp. VKM Ac-1396 TaxID=2783821 RepID=UPI00188BA6E9|nr:aminotransferase class I/II-fold pyridoxal phosphate-dependent enzyme [Frigoribacterium sp. VKM Ac-1396]MBF4601618.1 aminotransferase class I/II-fold pyridoxal phosphate-dependent enzyme [Frigoribacterium sp. VKM Ac-1396]
MTSRINLSAPDVGALERDAVDRAMRSGWVAPLGPEVDAFEREIAARVGVAAGVAVSSGTAALHLGLRGIGVGPGTTVVTSTFTFVATANAVVHAGARPFFVDCDPITGNLCPDLLDEALAGLAARGHRVSAVLPVDIYGRVADLDRIQAVADRHGVPVLCDSAESLGATAGGRAAGSFGRASAVSFNGNKIMTTSGGGMLLTDDVELADHARHLACQARLPVAHYEHAEIGYNYRLSNVLAALGRAQLTRLDDMIARRHAVRRRYVDLVRDLDGVTVLHDGHDETDNAWLTSLVFDDPARVHSVGRALADADIETRRLWKPMHQQAVFAGAGRLVSGAAERLFDHGLSLPSGSGLTDDEVSRVVDVLRPALESARD